MLVIAEATWASMLLGASVNGSPGPHVRLPFLALAIPAVVAVVWSAVIFRLRWRWWWKAPLLAVGVLIGLALSAGLIAALSRSGSWWSAATEPWSASGHPAAVVAGMAWLGAILAWGRGVWLGIGPPSFRHVVWSLAIGGAAFIGVFAGRGDHHATAFLANTSGAGWLFFVFFPLTAAAAALARERELEETWLARSGNPPGLVWVSVLALPMVGIGLIALFLAVIVGPGAPIVGRGVTRAVEAVWGTITAAVRWLWDLLPRSHAAPVKPPGAARGGRVAGLHPGGQHSSFVIPAVVLDIVAVLAAVVALYFIVRFIVRYAPSRLKWRPTLSRDGIDEERTSLFSWGHLWSQLRAAVWRWPRRRRPAIPAPVPAPMGARSEAEQASVRQAYRWLLSTARATGRGRMRSETAHELETRLSVELTPVPAEALRELTVLYHDVRYGAAQPGDSAQTAAVVQSNTVRAALEEMAGEAKPGRSVTAGR